MGTEIPREQEGKEVQMNLHAGGERIHKSRKPGTIGITRRRRFVREDMRILRATKRVPMCRSPHK